MSEGEEFISDFLESESIYFEREITISDLNNDSKKYRKADFYIPKYKIYVEFFGQWNLENQKERYIEKKKVYSKNKIPCVYLYPENLGIIEYVFHKRIVEVFEKYEMKKELFKYRITEICKECFDRFVFLVIGILIIIFNFSFEENDKKLFLGIGIVIVLFQAFKIGKFIKQVFSKGITNRRIYY